MDKSYRQMSEEERAVWMRTTMAQAVQSTLRGDTSGDEKAVNQILEIACEGDMEKFRAMCLEQMEDFFLKNPVAEDDQSTWGRLINGVHARFDRYDKEGVLVKRSDSEKKRLMDVLDACLEEEVSAEFQHKMAALINFEKPGMIGEAAVSADAEGAYEASPCSTLHARHAERMVALLRHLLKANTFISNKDINMITEGLFHVHGRAMYLIGKRNSLAKQCSETDKALEKLKSKSDRTKKQSQMLTVELSNGSKLIVEKQEELQKLKEAIERMKINVGQNDDLKQRAKELNRQADEARVAVDAEFAGLKAKFQNVKETDMKLNEQVKLLRAESKAMGKNISEDNKKLKLLRREAEKEERKLQERMSLIENRVKKGEADALQAKHKARIAMLARAHEEALTNIRNFESLLKRSKDNMTGDQIRLAMSFWEKRCDKLADLIANATSLSSEELKSRDVDPLPNDHDETANTGVAHIKGTFEFLHHRRCLLESAGLLSNAAVSSD